MIQSVSKLDAKELPLTGGVNEVGRTNRMDLGQCLKMENWRLTEDGTRVMKRLGLSEEVTNFAEDIYGYVTYYDATPSYCELAVLESCIKRKVGAGAWTSIHTFTGNMVHPVIPLEIQDKIFVINEVNSRMVLSNGDDCQIGISPPTTIPAIGLDYSTTLFWNACDTLPGVWTESDTGSGDVAVSTNVPVGYNTFKFFSTDGGASGGTATISRDIGTIGNRFRVWFRLYINLVSTDNDQFVIYVQNGSMRLKLAYNWTHFRIYSSATQFTYINKYIALDTWYEFDIRVDASDPDAASADVTINGIYVGKYDCSDTSGTLTDGVTYAGLTFGIGIAPIFYLDNIGVYTTAYNDDTASLYRYAITYARSGNYGCESNPIKSKIDAPLFYDLGGVNDLTITGEYTGATPRTIKVEVTAASTPDTISVSYLNDGTYQMKDVPVTKTMYLSYGITLNFAATTGHAVGSYWTIACMPISTSKAVGEMVFLNGIPISSDPQVDQRKIYRSSADGTSYYWLATIYDNTTTTFYDDTEDGALGALMEDDRDILPNGKLSCWWDNRLWVSGNNIIYYSDISKPEEFDIGVRYIDVHSGFFDDEITGIIDFRDSLYVFKRHAVFIIIRKIDGTYGRFQIHKDIDCIAPWSLLEVNGLLMFLSSRGLELYNGESLASMKFSVEVKTTLRTIDFTKLDFITAIHNKDYNEVWFSIPDRTGSNSAITIVFNYLTGENWYFFSFYKIPSCLVRVRNSVKKPVIKMGTRDGYLLLCNSGYQDGSTDITATIRKPWVTLPVHGIWRSLETEFEIPSTKTLTANIYVDFDKDVFRTAALIGNTPTTTDASLRRVIWQPTELGQRGKHLSVEYINAENVGADLKINHSAVMYARRERKQKVYGD